MVQMIGLTNLSENQFGGLGVSYNDLRVSVGSLMNTLFNTREILLRMSLCR